MKALARFVAVVAVLIMLMSITPSWGQPACASPGCNPTVSDVQGNTAGGLGALSSVKGGRRNTGFGTVALPLLNDGNDNTAIGSNALRINTDGSSNTAVGSGALHDNNTGNLNTAVGALALFANIGDANTAIGYNALPVNSSGTFNTASGTNTLFSNQTGSFNTAAGGQALYSNLSGASNTAVGINSLGANTTGNNNTALGTNSLFSNTDGSNNTAIGFKALKKSLGTKNVGIGYQAGVTLTNGNNNIYIGNSGAGDESQTIRIGTAQTHTFIAGINTASVGDAQVMIDTTTGQLGIVTSSVRYKQDIETMANRSEGLLKLRPVTFAYKDDTAAAPHYGLIAEEVATVYPELVTRTPSGNVQTVKYHELIPMLLNELQREHRARQEDKAEMALLRKEIAELRLLVGSRVAE